MNGTRLLTNCFRWNNSLLRMLILAGSMVHGEKIAEINQSEHQCNQYTEEDVADVKVRQVH